ncbi:MAG TPA: ABC transporter ATP-binding protein [Mycobacteriales bacterium]|nr:ABC transporter ATP-binding protein [Mycobacteriales bacterium]
MSAVISVTDLTVARGGRTVLHEVSFEVEAGTVTGLLGPSGCGKTTLMRCLVGVQLIAGGSVQVLGQPAGSPPLRSAVGYVTQSPAIYSDLTLRENLRYFARVLGASRDQIGRVVEQVDLSAQIDQVVASMSGGERARASLASALLGAPRVLVLDEPTVGLDPVLRRSLWSTFRELADSGVALIVSSHVMDEAERCQRLLLMRSGRIVADSTPSGLLESTGCETVEAAFLHIADSLDAA